MRRVGFISGVFDCFHDGHKALLRAAKAYGCVVFVSINSDSYVKRKKGDARPVDTAEVRKKKLLESGLVDIVFINNDDSPLELIKQVQPNIIFVGDDYTKETTVGAKEVQEWGGKVVIVKRVGGISTTKILKDRENG